MGGEWKGKWSEEWSGGESGVKSGEERGENLLNINYTECKYNYFTQWSTKYTFYFILYFTLL